MIDETGFRATVHINRFVTFRTRIFQLKILKKSSSVNFKTRLNSSWPRFMSAQCWLVWGGCCGGVRKQLEVRYFFLSCYSVQCLNMHNKLYGLIFW